MSVVRVNVVQRDGAELTIDDAPVGAPLMEVIKARGVEGIFGECGGSCACATCHVYVDPEWQEAVGQPEALEEMTLDMVSEITRDNSRLACQIILSPDLNGLRVVVAPGE